MKKIELLGKLTNFISIFFRYFIYLFIMIFIGVLSGGIGTFLFIILFDTLKKKLPLKTSIYKDYSEYLNNQIDIILLKRKFYKKLKININITIFISVLAYFSISFSTGKDKLFFTIFFIATFVLLLIQFIYFYFVYYKVLKVYNEKKASEKKLYKSDIIISSSEKENHTVKSSNTLTHKETIIISIVIGAISYLLASYYFGYYTSYVVETRNRSLMKKLFHYNYQIGIPIGIISSGIFYLIINKLFKNDDN